MYLLGVDAGSSRTRVVLTDLDGCLVRTAESAGANPIAHGVDQSFRTLRAVIERVLGQIDPAEVAACVIGIAGYSHLGFRQLLPGFVTSMALQDVCSVVSDCEVAFAAGSDKPSGILLLAGTGAVAAEIADHRAVRYADGAGWLLGDEGGGFWLGRKAAQTVLRVLDGRIQHTILSELLSDALGVPRERAALLAALYSQPPVQLARFAPLVMKAANSGDLVAQQIIQEAADCLVSSVAALSPFRSEEHEIVLAGGALHEESPLSELVATQLRARFDLNIRYAGRGEFGAIALAKVALNGFLLKD